MNAVLNYCGVGERVPGALQSVDRFLRRDFYRPTLCGNVLPLECPFTGEST
jgi:hypothetical protein